MNLFTTILVHKLLFTSLGTVLFMRNKLNLKMIGFGFIITGILFPAHSFAGPKEDKLLRRKLIEVLLNKDVKNWSPTNQNVHRALLDSLLNSISSVDLQPNSDLTRNDYVLAYKIEKHKFNSLPMTERNKKHGHLLILKSLAERIKQFNQKRPPKRPVQDVSDCTQSVLPFNPRGVQFVESIVQEPKPLPFEVIRPAPVRPIKVRKPLLPYITPSYQPKIISISTVEEPKPLDAQVTVVSAPEPLRVERIDPSEVRPIEFTAPRPLSVHFRRAPQKPVHLTPFRPFIFPADHPTFMYHRRSSSTDSTPPPPPTFLSDEDVDAIPLPPPPLSYGKPLTVLKPIRQQ